MDNSQNNNENQNEFSEHTQNSDKLIDENSVSFLIAEFSVLKSEVLERTKFQHQLISLNIVATGTFLGICFKLTPNIRSYVLMMLPLLIPLLAAAWAYHDHSIARIGLYIKKHMEKKTVLNWEHFLDSDEGRIRKRLLLPSIFFHARWTFLYTQLLVIAISLLLAFQNEFQIIEKVLLCIEALAVVTTFFVVRPSKMWR